jgi:hypothetical protein
MVFEHFKNLPMFRGARNQRGNRLGNWFRSFFRYVVPLLKKHAVPVLKKGANIIGTEAVKTAANVATDKIAGKIFEEACRTRVNEGLENISKQWKKKGSGKRKKNKLRNEKLV